MSIENVERISGALEKDVIREEVPIHMAQNVLNLLIIQLGSMVIPTFIFMGYILLYFVPNFLEAPNFLSIFTQWNSLIHLIIMPIMIVGCFILYLFFMGLITRTLWRYMESKSPSKSGVIPRNIPSKTLDYYHKRSFMIKNPKNVFVKGMFPWLANWFYNFVGTSKIGKGSTIEEQILADKFIDVGKNSYIGVNSSLATHFVEGIFGNISYFKIKIGDNVTLAGLNGIAPGCEVGDNTYLLPLASAAKHSVLKGSKYYFGIPLRKIFKKKIMNYLNITAEDLDKSEELRIRQQAQKEMEMKKEGK
jgi:acetyltransferase-like isoleucine patch superfamily enzyme